MITFIALCRLIKEFICQNYDKQKIGVIVSKHLIIASFLLITGLTATTLCFDAKTDDIWVNGEFSFLSNGVKYKHPNRDYSDFLNQNSHRSNQVNLSSAVRFFLVDHFCLGPRFSWYGIDYATKDKFLNFFELNGELGYVGVSNNNNYPYLIISPGAEFNSDYSRFVLPFSAGLMLAITEHLGLQFEFGLKFAFEQYTTYNTIAIGIGICGFGKNSAISILNQFQPY